MTMWRPARDALHFAALFDRLIRSGLLLRL